MSQQTFEFDAQETEVTRLSKLREELDRDGRWEDAQRLTITIRSLTEKTRSTRVVGQCGG